jgi:undecaprenyl-diphosphatase
VILIIIFALIQGFTEFLPISSQGHLILFNNIFNISELSTISILEMNVIVHMGSLLAVILYYRRTIIHWIFSINMIVRPDLDKKSFHF